MKRYLYLIALLLPCLLQAASQAQVPSRFPTATVLTPPQGYYGSVNRSAQPSQPLIPPAMPRSSNAPQTGKLVDPLYPWMPQNLL